MNEFKSIPIEKDTKITSEQEVQVLNLPALHQNWSWDGIAAEFIIFQANDVKIFTDNELFKKVKEYYIQTYIIEPKTTYR